MKDKFSGQILFDSTDFISRLVYCATKRKMCPWIYLDLKCYTKSRAYKYRNLIDNL